jgi:hypothetical protein
MTSIRVGAAVDAIPGPRYFERHGLLELHPPLSFPRAATLARWRQSIPEACEIAIAVTRRTHGGRDGALRFDKPGARAWVDETLAALSPRFVLLSTGPELSTGSRDRALLAQFVEAVRAKGPMLVWQPRGLWDDEDARRYAAQIGCVVALDLLGASSGPQVPGPAELMGLERKLAASGSVGYGRIEALGTHARLGDGHLRRAVDEALSSGAEELRLVIESEDAMKKAARLAAIVEGLADESGGSAALRRRAVEGEEQNGDDDELDDDDEELDDELDDDEE